MKILVTGSREWPPTYDALEAISSILEEYVVITEHDFGVDYAPVEMINGMSDQGGVDTYCYMWARGIGWPVDPCPAEVSPGHSRPLPWQYAKRNKLMVDKLPDIVLAFYVEGARNRGTQMTVEMAEAKGIPVRKFHFNPSTNAFWEE